MAITGYRKRNIVLIVVIAAIVLAGFGLFGPGGQDDSVGSGQAGTFAVRRGDLIMSVTESGTIKARNAVEIESKVEGQTTIITIVPEGSYISEDDVANGKILVELDSSKLRDQINQQKITFNTAQADYTGAKESLVIQENQNDSDIQQGLLNVKFGRMDLQKYLGSGVADMLIADYENTGTIPSATVLLSDPNQLGGSSQQQLRQLKEDIGLAEEEYKRAETALGWTQKLYDKSYVAKSELETDQLKVKRLNVNWQRSQTAFDLFLKYDFPKQAEKLFSDYLEAERQLERIYAQTRSKLAQAQARLSSYEARYLLQKERLERIKEQLDACVMRATEPGMVIYASSRSRWGGSRTNIDVGEDIRERELIMTITNAEEMDVDVKVHETNVDKVQVGQPVKIVVDAQPDKVYQGEVFKVAPLPDPAGFFGNQDLKVYSTEVSLEGVDESIKPGMNARVEILIAELTDVLTIPIQCVANRNGKKVCYLAKGNQPKEQVVETGSFNDRFVEILSGIEEDQEVLLNPPRLMMADEIKSSAGSKKASDGQSGERQKQGRREGPPRGAPRQGQPREGRP
ncbi:MAG: HlyD family efflux transporter periplasmic adaptor subunit [Planctomycetota bacterium]|jgi:HlyD family secretion protein